MTPNPFPNSSNLLSPTFSHHCHSLASPKIKINRNHQKDPQLPGTKFANASAFAPFFPCFPPLPTEGEDGTKGQWIHALSHSLHLHPRIFNLSLHWCLLINISTVHFQKFFSFQLPYFSLVLPTQTIKKCCPPWMSLFTSHSSFIIAICFFHSYIPLKLLFDLSVTPISRSLISFNLPATFAIINQFL